MPSHLLSCQASRRIWKTLLLVVAVLVLLIRGMTAQQVDSNTTCTICTYLLSFNTISSARNSCGGGFTTIAQMPVHRLCKTSEETMDAASTRTTILLILTCIATYALWDSCNVEVPAVCSNPFPEEPASRCPLDTPTLTPTPVTMSGFSLVTPAMKVVAGCVLSVLTLIRTNS